jgi:hypothetical protein
MILRQGIAIAFPVGSAHEGSDDVEIPFPDLGCLAPEIGKAQVDIELEEVDTAWSLGHVKNASEGVGRTPEAVAGGYTGCA